MPDQPLDPNDDKVRRSELREPDELSEDEKKKRHERANDPDGGEPDGRPQQDDPDRRYQKPD